MKRRSCLLLGSLLLSGVLLSGCGKDEAPPEPVRPVVFVEVRPESNQDFGRFAGNIQARYQSVLGFRVAGRIARRDVDVGAEVKKGDLLATLDPTDQQNTVRARQGDLANVQAQLINAQAKAAAQQARDQLSYSELRSDHDAVVTEWKVEAGQVVTAGQEVVTLARPDIKEAVIDLPDTLADQLPSDVVFTVASQLNPEVNTTATIREIEPQADRTTRTRRARLSLAQTPAAFRLGTAISVTLSSTITPRMRLPINALQEVDGKRQVWIVDSQSQTVNPRAVTIASRDSDSFVLTDGVKAGEKVVSAGVNSLKPGQKVKLDEESPR
ncbi:efflux RND transporter periplasmic adaptor subunit [Pseudomonas fragariae (ex Marin et al. 2024)]|uniref:efflux RND transporter periplasmic adaptor subunit n=1 Tax=Pseudomonas fragariae (ex Marin et al. 2024) TaxID=3080056 RepID=UPI003F7AB8E3